MILIDSSAWIDFFSNKNSIVTSIVESSLSEGEDVAIIPLILSEVLSGFRSDLHYRAATKVLLNVPILPIGIQTHLEAAALYLQLRKRGVTVRGVADCILAQACIESRAYLLTLDRDFKKISNHSALKVYNI